MAWRFEKKNLSTFPNYKNVNFYCLCQNLSETYKLTYSKLMKG